MLQIDQTSQTFPNYSNVFSSNLGGVRGSTSLLKDLGPSKGNRPPVIPRRASKPRSEVCMHVAQLRRASALLPRALQSGEDGQRSRRMFDLML